MPIFSIPNVSIGSGSMRASHCASTSLPSLGNEEGTASVRLSAERHCVSDTDGTSTKMSSSTGLILQLQFLLLLLLDYDY